MPIIGNDWDEIIGAEFQKPYYQTLRAFLKEEYATKTVYPNMYHIFNALKTTPRSKVKVVILGQDPYHGPGQAHGLCFSVQKGIQPPPSLVNIYKELETDVGMPRPTHGYLQKWAEEGVLLLNATLTVRAGAPMSHKGKGWETFTDAVITALNQAPQPIVFLLWGGNARAKKALITNPRHLILETVHPSPLSAYNGFFGCRHFSRANAFLTSHGISPIHWDAICEER
jgi:uracil-DNA glycosylase